MMYNETYDKCLLSSQNFQTFVKTRVASSESTLTMIASPTNFYFSDLPYIPKIVFSVIELDRVICAIIIFTSQIQQLHLYWLKLIVTLYSKRTLARQ